jgi:hypothetical protein
MLAPRATGFDENESAASRPQEVIDCFLRTRKDVIVLDDTLIFG